MAGKIPLMGEERRSCRKQVGISDFSLTMAWELGRRVRLQMYKEVKEGGFVTVRAQGGSQEK